VKKPSKKARSLGAASGSQRQKLSWERQKGVRAGVRAQEHEAADELGMTQRQLLRDRASHRHGCDANKG
jgi:hypothetical protein